MEKITTNSMIRSFEENDTNPFINETVTDVLKQTGQRWRLKKTKNNGYKDLITIEDPKAKNRNLTIAFLEEKVVDKTEFIKIFREDGLKDFFELKTPGIRMFSYLSKNLKPNADTVEFIIKDALKHGNYKDKKNAYIGITQLLQAKIIARSQQSWRYYINPTVFFNGNRITLVKTYLTNEHREIE